LPWHGSQPFEAHDPQPQSFAAASPTALTMSWRHETFAQDRGHFAALSDSGTHNAAIKTMSIQL
jgi:hypothetical protein